MVISIFYIQSNISVNSEPPEYLMNNLVWIPELPHTHQRCEYLFVCYIFVDFNSFVPGAGDDEVVDGEDRGDPVGVTVEGVDAFVGVDVPDLD